MYSCVIYLTGEDIGDFDELLVNGVKYVEITNNSQLENGAGYITNSGIPNAPPFPSTLGAAGQTIKLQSNPSNGFEYVKLPTETSDLTNNSGFITSASVPTDNSELNNDSDFITAPSVPSDTSDLRTK